MKEKALSLITPREFNLKKIKLDVVFLDPNNPRFNPSKFVRDEKISEESVQIKALEGIRNFGVDDLTESISRIGFLPIDKIVVRALPTGAYVVVEGNRRVAALKLLKSMHEAGEVRLRPEILNSIQEFEAIVYQGKRRDISWLVQGIRHISGVRGWGGLEQGELVYKLVEEAKIEINDAAGAIGIQPREATRLLRSYYGYLQFKEDEELGDRLDPPKFVFFIEGIFGRARRTPFQDWLEWDDEEKIFKNNEKVKEFISWIVSPEENKEPIISKKADFKYLEEALVSYPSLFEKFREKPDIEYLRREIDEREYVPRELEKLKGILEDTSERLRSLPTIAIKTSDLKTEFIKLLKEIKALAEEHLTALGN